MLSEKQKLLRRLQAARFGVIEANIYLDSHPTCRHGLKYFKEKKAELEELTAEYESKYGPITAVASNTTDHWEWVSTPFPWERGES